MRWIYISPHLDDAALSAGGFIYEQTHAGIPVEIWNIVCGFPPEGELTPLAQLMHFQWQSGTAEETVKIRRTEDAKATDILGAKATYFDIPDCIYRRGPDGEALYTNIFIEPHEAEADLPAQIAQSLLPLLQPDDRVICQLGIGGHVDHILVRRAVELLEHSLWYVADQPYLFKRPDDLDGFVAGMKESRHPITEAGLRAWVEATLAYESQLSSLFENPDQVSEMVTSYYAERGGFPLWTSEIQIIA